MEHEVLPTSLVRSRLLRRRQRHAAFTLIELAIVVAIVGVLAVIAVVSYRRYILHSKITEAEGVISAVRIAQEDFRAETGQYANLGATFCPGNGGAIDRKVQFLRTCTGGAATWETLPVHFDGPMHFQFATMSGPAGTAPTLFTWGGWPATPTANWYVVAAQCDMDPGNSNNTELAGSSFENRIFRRNEGL